MKKFVFVIIGVSLLAAACNSKTAVNNPSPAPVAVQPPAQTPPIPVPTPTPTPAPTPTNSSNLLATINNSGSTNASPFAIKIFGDGSASVLIQNKPEQDFKAGTIDTKTLVTKLQNAGDFDKILGHCMKSVSFGTTTTVTYNGKTSGDISCSSTGAVNDLYNFVNQLEQQLKISPGRRI